MAGEGGAVLGLVRSALTDSAERELTGPLANQRSWMVNAEVLEAKSAVVGSGAVEKAVDLVVSRRYKRPGMSRERTGVEAIVALRADVLNQAGAA